MSLFMTTLVLLPLSISLSAKAQTIVEECELYKLALEFKADQKFDSAFYYLVQAEHDEGCSLTNESKANIYKEKSVILDRSGRLEEGRIELLKALNLFQIENDSLEVAKCLNNLGANSYGQNDVESAYDYWLKSANMKKAIGDSSLWLNSLLNIASAAYYDDEYLCDSLIQICSDQNFESRLTSISRVSLKNLHGLRLADDDQYIEAKKYFEEARAICLSHNIVEFFEAISWNLIETEVMLGDAVKASDLMHETDSVMDAWESALALKNLDEIQAKFNQAQANATLAQTQLTAQKKQRNLILLISALLFAGAFLFMRFRRQNSLQRARTEAVMQTREQEEERISQLLWTEIGKAMKQRGESSTSVFKGDAKTLDGAVQAARYLSAQHFNPYLQVGLARAVEYACELFGTQYDVTVKSDVEDVPVPLKQRGAMYKTFKRALVDHLDAPGVQVVHVALKDEDGKAAFTILSDHPPKQSALFKSAEAEVVALGGKLKYKTTGEGHRTRIKLPYPA